MAELLENPLLGLSDVDEFPSELWYLRDERADKYGGYRVDNPEVYPDIVHCLAVFRTPEAAEQFSALLDSCNAIPLETTFHGARDIALAANRSFKALALMDDYSR